MEKPFVNNRPRGQVTLPLFLFRVGTGDSTTLRIPMQPVFTVVDDGPGALQQIPVGHEMQVEAPMPGLVGLARHFAFPEEILLHHFGFSESLNRNIATHSREGGDQWRNCPVPSYRSPLGKGIRWS